MRIGKDIAQQINTGTFFSQEALCQLIILQAPGHTRVLWPAIMTVFSQSSALPDSDYGELTLEALTGMIYGHVLSIKAEIFIFQAILSQLPELPLPERIRQCLAEVMIVLLKSSTRPVTGYGELIMEVILLIITVL